MDILNYSKIPVKFCGTKAQRALVAKLMHGIAAECDCAVRYNDELDRFEFEGPEEYKAYIIEETLKFIED